MELRERTYQVRTMEVVADLLAIVSDDRVWSAADCAAHEVAKETVQLGAGVVRTGQPAPSEADGRRLGLPTGLVDQHVTRCLRNTAERVRRGIGRHRHVDVAAPAMLLMEARATNRVPRAGDNLGDRRITFLAEAFTNVASGASSSRGF
jgi:hypothetical protein